LYGTLQVVTEQPPRRVLASRRLLFSEVRVPRLDPSPRRKRGLGFKTRGERRRKAASVGRRPEHVSVSRRRFVVVDETLEA
jgi:hypothetical protein